MFGRATIRLGIGPHSSLMFFFLFAANFVIFSLRATILINLNLNLNLFASLIEDQLSDETCPDSCSRAVHTTRGSRVSKMTPVSTGRVQSPVYTGIF